MEPPVQQESRPQLIQVTTPVSAGSSGGGLFDSQGRLLGIISFGANGQSLNFAHPSEWIAELRQGGMAPVPTAHTEPQYSVTLRPQQLFCRLQTRAMWALFSSGTEMLEEIETSGELSLSTFHQQLPVGHLSDEVGSLPMVLSDLDRNAGYVRFSLTSGAFSPSLSKETVFFFWVDDEGAFRMTFVEPTNFHGQLRLRTVSGSCDPVRSKVFPNVTRSAPPVVLSDLARGEEQLRRGNPANALPHFLRACNDGKYEGCLKAAQLTDSMGLTLKSKELREQAERLHPSE